MALVAPSIATIVAGNLAAAGVIGVSQVQLASAISLGFTSYVLSSVIVNTADVGTLGTGTGFGQGMFLAPPVLQGSLRSTFDGAGIIGPFREPLIFALSNAISQSLLTATISTFDVGVGVGAGVVTTLIPNSVTSVSIMNSMFAANGMIGPMSSNIATAIALGIDAALPSSRGFTVVAGAGSIVPSVGVGIGKLI